MVGRWSVQSETGCGSLGYHLYTMKLVVEFRHAPILPSEMMRKGVSFVIAVQDFICPCSARPHEIFN